MLRFFGHGDELTGRLKTENIDRLSICPVSHDWTILLVLLMEITTVLLRAVRNT
jgi:hypothetical protein